ncbi:MAG TPA: RHS repeat-associated core domain-containing protein, partial [Gammaproteobacteria bacterium]
DLATRTLEIAEQGYPTETYIVAASDWTVQDLGFFQSITYTIEDGDLTIDGGFLMNPSIGFGWLQTREGQLQADSYDMLLPAETETYYYHTDHLGTPKALTDQNQQIAWRADYTPFGMANITTGQASNNLRFAGQYFDAETGLHYNWFRYYSPETGRYITSDPIGLLGGVNAYAYVGGNPISRIDPLGLAYVETNIANGTTTFNPVPYNAEIVTIPTRVDVTNNALPGADGPYTTSDINWIPAGTKSPAYGPDGAYIDTGDPRGRDIHGGGSCLDDPYADKQGWCKTLGCTRGQNEDVERLGEAIDDFKEKYPGVPIPYIRK